jgi:lipopolysaccharide export system protein LptC
LVEPLPASPAGRDARLARWREHSRGVRRLRVLLPAAIVALVVAVAGWVGIRGVLADLQTSKAAEGGLHMTNPRFTGRDEGGRQYVLEAKEAVRDARDLDKVAVQAPGVTLDYGGARPSVVRARDGLFSQKAGRLQLTGGVVMDDGKGAHLESPAAEVDTRTGDVAGRGGVTGTSPLGRFQAGAYLVKGKGAEVVFSGGVRAHLENQPEAPK